MQMTYERFGRSVTIADDGKVTSAVQELPANIRYLIEYGWKQSLSDAYAGAKNADEFEGKLRARVDAILKGTVKSPGTGAGRGPTKSRLEREIWRIAEAFIFGLLSERAAKAGKIAVEKSDIKKYTEALVARDRARLTEEAEYNLEAIREKVEESDDILSELMGVAKPQE